MQTYIALRGRRMRDDTNGADRDTAHGNGNGNGNGYLP
jgi:hypothetical protein